MSEPLRTLFLGRKPAASEALRLLVDKGFDVVAAIAPMPSPETFWRPLLEETARELRIPVRSAEWLETRGPRGGDEGVPLAGLDLVLSFLYWRRIGDWLIDLPRVGCFNVHPGPLPEFRGRRGYNHAILEGCAQYGATIHWVSSGFDEGDLVDVRRFPFDPATATALSLERETMATMLDMFDGFLDLCARGVPVPREPQVAGRSATKAELLELMRVHPGDAPDVVARKVRAFWYPPYAGATVEVGGRVYTLVDDDILRRLGEFLHGRREAPP